TVSPGRVACIVSAAVEEIGSAKGVILVLLDDGARRVGLERAMAAGIVMEITFPPVCRPNLFHNLIHSRPVHVVAARVRKARSFLDQVPLLVVEVGSRIALRGRSEEHTSE